MRTYRLRCCGCGASFEDDGLLLECPTPHSPALLRTVYPEKRFSPAGDASILRYRAWLPLGHEIATGARVAVYRSAALGRELGLDDLWVAFSGWRPERGATLPTGTFKDLEAYAVLGRYPAGETRPLVVASAGNTGAAFADACSALGVAVVLVVPLDAWPTIAACARVAPPVVAIGLAGAQYDDAIAFARTLTESGDFIAEGGVRNVARRDGMGTVMLAAVEAIGRLPDVYVQAVGSGAGALAADEAARRVVADGRFGDRAPRLLLVQNAPYTPMHDAWQRHASTIADRDDTTARSQIAQLASPVLSNRTPPYALPGGVREALEATGGDTAAVDNAAVARATALFERCEGIDPDPAAAVALAGLIAAREAGSIARDATVLLHATGGGRRRIAPKQAPGTPPSLVMTAADAAAGGLERVRALGRTS